MPKQPGLFQDFKGLWVRDEVDNCPPDHFPECLNNIYGTSGVGTRDGLSAYNPLATIVRMALYKPLPPFTGTNVPRIIALNAAGNLIDVLLNQSIYLNAAMKSFGLVNFFGRCFISPSDGKIGLPGVNVQLYDGSGNPTRDAGGAPPTTPLTCSFSTSPPGWTGPGTYLLSYALETSSGFITQPCTPFVGVDTFGGGQINVTNLPLGPAGTVARWIILTQSFPLSSLGPLGGPWTVAIALVSPLYLFTRVGDNTSLTVNLNFFDENLQQDATYLLAQLQTIPAGVGLAAYKGRMISYGENSDPTLVRVSEIGQPEAFSATSGFIITDPTDSTGVRSCTEYTGNLYIYKQQRGYVTQDNQQEASTWQLINFEKSRGTEQQGIAQILDAIGAASEGYVMASRSGLYFFNGTFIEPELSYKIRDLWLRISQQYFYLTQVSQDPINKRIYILCALDSATSVSHVIYGDYRDGLNPMSIKWSLWQFPLGVTSILTYSDFTSDVPTLVTRFSGPLKIYNLDIKVPNNLGSLSLSDDGTAIPSFFQLAGTRFSLGVSQFTRVRLRGYGPCTLSLTAYGEDEETSFQLANIVIPNDSPGREYSQLMNLVTEQCRITVTDNNLNEAYQVIAMALDGQEIYDERPR